MPESPTPRPLPDPNPVTRAAHRREAFWQITVPFLLAFLLILLLVAGVIWTAVGGVGEVTRWVDVSIIWMLSPQLFFSLINLALLSAIVFGLSKLLDVLPRYTRIVQDFFVLVRVRVREISDRVVEPVVRVHSVKAAMDTFWRSLHGRYSKH